MNRVKNDFKTGRLTAIVLLIFWMVLIFYMSSQTAEVSGGNSTEIAEQIAPVIVPGYTQMNEAQKLQTLGNLDYLIRKGAHAGEYAILGILFMLSLSGEKKKKALISWVCCVLYAASDEVHQLFVPGRAGMLADVGIDSVGALLGICFCWIICCLVSRKKSGRNRF